MYIFAYAMQLLALLCALGGAGMALLQLWQGRADWLNIIEKAHWIISGALLLASALLLHGLFWQDYSLVYVASYTDRFLPIF
ncbi:MAG: heme lyase CcmF/NrfE family subunit, partial [Desulfovibrionaceae bacterium]|nr:heme lyase CcmF/NrfE family subunit [Desulfovibrionaceae bacterium]